MTDDTNGAKNSGAISHRSSISLHPAGAHYASKFASVSPNLRAQPHFVAIPIGAVGGPVSSGILIAKKRFWSPPMTTAVRSTLSGPDPGAALAELAQRLGDRLSVAPALREQHANTTTWLANQP